MSDLKDYVETRLFEAGKALLRMPANGERPRGYGSSWLLEHLKESGDYPNDMRMSFGNNNPRQMEELYEVDRWCMKLANHCKKEKKPWEARALSLRMLVHPLSDRHLFTFKRIGDYMGGYSDTAAKNWYASALDRLITLNGEEIQNQGGYVEFMDDTFDSTYHGF